MYQKMFWNVEEEEEPSIQVFEEEEEPADEKG